MMGYHLAWLKRPELSQGIIYCKHARSVKIRGKLRAFSYFSFSFFFFFFHGVRKRGAKIHIPGVCLVDFMYYIQYTYFITYLLFILLSS